MHMKYATLAAILTSTTLSTIQSPASADDEAIETIIVTANRREQSISDIGNSVSVLTSADLESGQFIYTLDALATLPGVAISQNGPFGGTASVSIRGAGGDRTLVFIDGVRMNDPSSPGNAYDFGSLDSYNIERIEVLRGPQSVLYGSDAVGGVVNIITKSGGTGTGYSAFAEAGSFETVRAGATAFGGSETLGYNFSFSGTHSAGISAADEADGNTEEDGFDGLTLSGKVTARPSDLVSAELIARYSDNRSDFDSFGPVDGDQESNLTELSVVGRASADSASGHMKHAVSLEYAKIDRENFTDGLRSFLGEGKRKTLDYLGIFEPFAGWTLTGGAQHEIAEAATVDPSAITTNSLLTELAFEGVKGLVVTGGLRYVDHETFGDSTTARVTGSYRLEDTGSRIFANWAEGFKSPSVFQLTYVCTFCGLTDPNSDLQPETSEGYEIGVEQELFSKRLLLGATWYRSESEGAIIFTFSDGYQNLGQSRSEGVEFMFEAQITDDLSLRGNVTHTDAVDLATGDQLIRQPELTSYTALDWQVLPDIAASISVTYNDEELNYGGGSVDAWTRVDLRASWTITDHLQVYGRVDNLLDEHYQHVSGYGTPGLSGFIGLRANW